MVSPNISNFFFAKIKGQQAPYQSAGRSPPCFTVAQTSLFNPSGSDQTAEIIAKSQSKKLNYEMVDFHSSRPGHDLRYSLSGEKMESMGWVPKIKVQSRIKQVVEWSLKNSSWIEL